MNVTRVFVTLAFWLAVAATGFGQTTKPSMLEWSELPDLPDDLGLAGPFAGLHGNALIVAGGANFPRPVWDNDKAWHDSIYLLARDEAGTYSWKDGGKLPRPQAYGSAVSVKEGVVCIGGNDSEKAFADVFLLSYQPGSGEIKTTEFPPLPEPCAFGSATMVGRRIYMTGGQSGGSLDTATNHFWMLDLDRRGGPDFKWETLDPMPGPSRALHIAATQHNGYHDAVYVMSGRRQNGDETEFLTDVWEYTPKTGKWRQRKDVPRCVMAGPGIGYGQSHIFVLGGADGSLFHRSDELKDSHPGFPREALAYHTITDTWTSAGEIPRNHVTTIAVRWDGDIIVPSGEIRPRVRSAKVWKVTPQRQDHDFGAVNYVVLFGYLLAMVGIGVYFTSKNKNTDDFFRGGKRIPWWAAGCSIFATMLSSLTYTGVPSKSYAQDWVYAIGNFMIPVVAVVAVFVALPFYRRIDATSAYEYLEKRFNSSVRIFGSASFTLFHIFRMAVVMSLTGLALAVATPLTPTQSVLLMGVLSIIYCTMGGIEAVIWTDVFQVIILVGGALLSMIWIIAELDGGATALIELAKEDYKLQVFDFRFDFSTPTFWVVLLGGISSSIVSYGSDQSVVQRYLTTNSEKSAAKSIWTNALLSIPSTLIFFSIGTALYVLYKTHPLQLDPLALQNTDAIFPYFIVTQLPQGVAGLLIAGVFSAAMSSLDSSMNSVASALTTDFYQRFRPNKTEGQYLYFARWITALVGIAGTVLALLMASWNIKSLWDQLNTFIGLFAGGLGGLFLLGLFTKRANGTGAVIGLIASAIVQYYVKTYTDIFLLLYTFSGLLSCFVIGYLASLFFPTKEGAKI